MATVELMAELDNLVRLLEASIPANPVSPQNEKLAKSLQKDVVDYFNKLEQAIDYSKLEQIYFKNVREVKV